MLLGRFELSVRQWTAIIACAAVVVYLHTLGHEFAFDDRTEVLRNAQVRSLTYLTTLFKSTIWAGAGRETHLYRPLTTVSFALNYALTGLSAWSYHLINIALHALVTVLLFRLALWWGLAPEAAGLGALLFAVHPIHVEVVANIAGRHDLLAATFMLAALFAHSQALRRGGIWMGVAPLAYGAAMLSKEIGAVTIGLFILQDGLLGREDQREASRWRRPSLYAAHGLILLAYLIIRWSVVGRFGIDNIVFIANPAAHASSWVRVMTATAVLGRGLGLLVAPVTLSPDYSYRAIPLVESPLNVGFLLTVLVVIALAVTAVAVRRREPFVPFAVGWYALTLLPVANLLFPIGTLFGERWLYLPSVAFCLLAGHLLAKGLPKVRPAIASLLLAGVVAALGLRTVTYASVWKDNLSLFTAAARVAPDSTRTHSNLGLALMEAGRTEEAIKAYDRALTIFPANYEALLILPVAYIRLDQLEVAERLYRRLLESSPNDVAVLHGLGVIRRLQGRLTEAADFWRLAVAFNANHSPSLNDLGTVRFRAGEVEQAQLLYERAVAADPTLPIVWYNLGNLHEQTKQPERAREAWRHFLEMAGDKYLEQKAEVRQKLTKTE
jgi:tetratricopeptide (TPR) repeat protein